MSIKSTTKATGERRDARDRDWKELPPGFRTACVRLFECHRKVTAANLQATKELNMESRSPEEVVRAWNDAFSRQDIDECMSYMSDDYIRHGDMSWETPLDRDSWGAMLKGFNAAFPGWSWEITSFVVSGNTVIVEAHESGVWTRPWEFLGISLEPSGEAYDDRDAVYFEVRDGLIRQTRVYITNNFARTYQIDKRIAELANIQSEPAG